MHFSTLTRESGTALAAPRRWPAGLLSVLVHGGAFLLVSMASFRARHVAEHLAPSEPERPVQLVLARPEGVNPKHRQDRYQDRVEFARDALPDDGANPDSTSSNVNVAGPSLGQVEKLVANELTLPRQAAAAMSVTLPGIAAVHGTSARIPIAGDVGAFIAEEQARLRAGRPVGEPARVALFGGPASEGRSFVFLIDRSKSMGHEGLGALEAAERELLVAIQPLQPHHKFQVIAYHHECVYLSRRELLPATDENKQSVRGFLSGLAAFGATEHEMGLQSALHHEPDAIYWLTDGGDPELSDPQIRRLTKLAGSRTSIHCIQFGFGASSDENSFLRRLAALNRGTYTYVDRSRS